MKYIWKSNSEDYLSLNKTLELHNMIIVVTSVSDEGNEYYPQAFSDEFFVQIS